jgi:hypothetical protein
MTRPAMALLVVVFFGGCARPAIPDPRLTVARYADAVAAGDAKRVHALLSERSRRTIREADVSRMLSTAKTELADQARAFAGPQATVRASATVRLSDGEDATLDLEDGEFRLTAAQGLPAEARSPTQALDQLRRALARRSYEGLVRLLVPRVRSTLERDLRSLVEGLRRPEGLDVRVSGDSAWAEIPEGHHVKLRREAGIWMVEDFD